MGGFHASVSPADFGRMHGMDFRAIGMGLIFALIWSSAFTSARMIVEAAPPLYALVLRFGLAGLIGVAIAKALGQHWKFSAKQWRGILIFGTCQNAIYLGLNFIAMQTVEAGLAAIIASSMPLLVATANWAFFLAYHVGECWVSLSPSYSVCNFTVLGSRILIITKGLGRVI